MTISFTNILPLKEFLARNVYFRLFSEIEKESGTSFWCTFSAQFFHKNDSYLIQSLDKVSMSDLISFSQYEIKYDIKFLFRQLLTSWTFLDHLLKQWLTGGKRGKTKIQKFEYLENGMSFLDVIRNIFHSFSRVIIWW